MPDMKVKVIDLRNITVNGIPLEIVIDEEIRGEIQSHHSDEVRTMKTTSRVHSISKPRWNNSGARSSRGRVIFSAAMGGFQ